MPVTYTQFLTLIATALRDENGLDLAHLIRPINPHGKDLVKEFRNPTVRRVVSVLPFEMRHLKTAAISVSIRRRYRRPVGRDSDPVCPRHYPRRKKALCRRVQRAHATGQVSAQPFCLCSASVSYLANSPACFSVSSPTTAVGLCPRCSLPFATCVTWPSM